MKRLILFVTFLLIPLLSFSQENYPKKQIQNGDTTVVITPVQLGLVNGIIQERNDLRDELVPAMDSLIVKQDSLLLSLNRKIQYLNEVDKTNQQIIENLKEQTLQVKHQNTKTCWIVGGVCISVGFLAGVLVMTLK